MEEVSGMAIVAPVVLSIANTVGCICVSLRANYGVQRTARLCRSARRQRLQYRQPLDQRDGASMPGYRSSNELRARGVRDLVILSMDGVVIGEGAKAVTFPHATVQLHRTSSAIPSAVPQAGRCIREQLKLIYGAINVKQARRGIRSSRPWRNIRRSRVWALLTRRAAL